MTKKSISALSEEMEASEEMDKNIHWPWNVDLKKRSEISEKKEEWPKITIVTPSYNHGEFIEDTIRSVLLQDYPNLEYIIIDGGSTDNTVEIIKKYEEWIDYWVSEPDKGQSDAINKGFKRATGVYGNWINSDDLLVKDALRNIAKHIPAHDPNTIFLGTCIHTDKNLKFQSVQRSNIRSFEDLLDLTNHWGNNAIAQQNVLFSVEEFRKVGGLRVKNHYAMDFELWGDLLLNGNKIKFLDFEVGIFRRYEGQKISDRWKTVNCLLRSAHKLVIRNQNWSLRKKAEITLTLIKYRIRFVKRMISLRSKVSTIKGRLSDRSVHQ